MRFNFSTAFLILILSISYSCNKNDDTTTIDPGNNPPTNTQYGEPFENIPTTEDIVMYEINLRAFSTNGNLQGIINRLDKLKELKINVIWLMPIHPIGEINSVNSPYSIKDYLSVSSEYGTLEDLRKLTDEAHKRDMAVIMDWVANHTAWDNSWINNTSWYTQDASGNIIHPPGTNWLDVADLNYDNNEMRQSMIAAMKYWAIEANIDGYRCDYADGVPADFWKQALDTLKSIPNRSYILLAEGNRSDHFNVGFDLNYGWDFYGTIKSVFSGQSASNLFQTQINEYSNIPEGKHKLRFTTNHDESAWDNTPMVLFNGKEGALAASITSIFMGGVLLFYTGQEVGRVNTVPFFSNSPINWNENPEMLQEYQKIMSFYAQSEVSKQGSNTNYTNSNVICFKKTLNDKELVIIDNIRDNQINFILPSELQNTNWKNALTNDVIELGSFIQLNNYQYLILTN
ncbi:MAG: alpha-amylase family glycosyl hydrolase [Bacteroidota bacterium]